MNSSGGGGQCVGFQQGAAASNLPSLHSLPEHELQEEGRDVEEEPETAGRFECMEDGRTVGVRRTRGCMSTSGVLIRPKVCRTGTELRRP